METVGFAASTVSTSVALAVSVGAAGLVVPVSVTLTQYARRARGPRRVVGRAGRSADRGSTSDIRVPLVAPASRTAQGGGG